MKNMARFVAVAGIVLASVSGASAVSFGTGGNTFDIDFVPISGSTNPASGYGIVNNNYYMGTKEITNDQRDKFKAELGIPVMGNPSNAYDESPFWMGTNVPYNRVSWYEAAQFVNWLNTSKGHQAAYKFTGTKSQSDYTLATWSAADADNGTNLYRHKDAMYYMPTEDEWVKAAYWNGTTLQTYATKAGESLHQGDGMSGIGWNYYDNGYATDPFGPWDVGSGSEELNGTFDMMGNVWEWMESPYLDSSYGTCSDRGLRGGAYLSFDYNLASSYRNNIDPSAEIYIFGYRVASDVPEPASLGLLSLGGLVLLKRKRRAYPWRT